MISYKITLLGDAAVGKTSLRRRFMGEGYKETYSMTIGADFAAYRLDDYTLQIWDLAGQMRFHNVIKAYYTGTRGSLIIFDITRPESYQNVSKWIEQLISNLNNEFVPIVLVGNKSDLRKDSPEVVEMERAIAYSQELSEWTGLEIPYYETSALTGDNVDLAFRTLVKNIDKQLGV